MRWQRGSPETKCSFYFNIKAQFRIWFEDSPDQIAEAVLFSVSTYFFVLCMCVCVCVQVHVCMCGYMCTCVHMPLKAICLHPMPFHRNWSPSSIRRASLSRTWNMSIGLDSLARAPPSWPLHLRPYRQLHTWSTSVLGTKLGSSCCHGSHWAISPAPPATVLKPNFPMREIVIRDRQSKRGHLSHLSLWAVVEQLTFRKILAILGRASLRISGQASYHRQARI